MLEPREVRLAQGDVLTSSDLIERLEQSADGGVAFARAVRKNLIEYVFLKNPKRE
jgi:hypothetical protein